MFKRFNLSILQILIICAVGMGHSAHAQQNAYILPPIPNSIIEEIEDLHHPFLLHDRDGFRNSRRLVKDHPFKPRAKEFFFRASSYPIKDTFWYVGDGPFSDSVSFKPQELKDEDFSAYAKIMLDVAVYIGLEQERVDINRIKEENLRLLNHIESFNPYTSNEIGFSYRKAQLTALVTLMYDMVYMRYDTVKRHEPTRQLKSFRDQLAAFCRNHSPMDFPPNESAVYGAALGLSSLFCISVYPHEWEQNHEFAVQSLLPDLYQAAYWTRTGMNRLVSDDNKFQVKTSDFDGALQLTIPWIECMKRLGYSYIVEKDSFARIAAALETHRIPGTIRMVQPYQSQRSSSQWLPLDIPLFTSDPLEEQLIASATDVEGDVGELLEEEPEEDIRIRALSPLGRNVENFKSQNVNIQATPRPLTLREQLEKYMLPRPENENRQPTPFPIPDSFDGGWKMPKRELLQTLWATVYFLAAQEAPRSAYRDFWENNAVHYDSHPYQFIYWKPLPNTNIDEHDKQQFVRYPDDGFTLFAETTPYGDFLLASQASKTTIMRSTYITQTDSFFMSENTTNWRWVHEIPVTATKVLSASEIQTVTETDEYINLLQDRLLSGTVSSASSMNLQTSMYSSWTTHSPAGKTVFARRHLSGLGSTYNITAHFPDPESKHKLEYINFKMDPGSDSGADPSIPGRLVIRPKEAIENTNPESIEEMRWNRAAQRNSNDPFQVYGILNIFFSPDSLGHALHSDGVMGQFLETKLQNPDHPFFYLTIVEQPGREMFEVKYASLPMPGLRFIEWKNGLEIIAMNTGDGIDNTFVKSDADLVIVSRDQSMGGVFYMMVNGTQLQVKYSPRQRDWTTLASVKGDPVTVAWNQRRLHTASVPHEGSAFYAPSIVGFQTPEGRIRFGKKNRQAVVLRD